MTELEKKLQNADAAILYISGQSNAHAHAQVLPEGEEVKHCLKHVFTLDHRIDRSLTNESLTWRQYTSQYNNLGEHQDNTATLGYFTAIEWEKRIENGEKLPDLYIVQISIGGEAILNGMWNMDMKPEIVDDDTVPTPLYHLALHTYRLVNDDMKARFKNPIALGWHWIGSESDCIKEFSESENLRADYDKFFDTMFDAIGFECPLYLYRLVFYKNGTAYIKGIETVNKIFEDYTCKYKNCSIVDCRKSPYWDENAFALGIFNEIDNIHYLAKVQKWFKDEFFKDLDK